MSSTISSDRPPVSDHQLSNALAEVTRLEPEVLAARHDARMDRAKVLTLESEFAYNRFLNGFRGIGDRFELWPVGLTLVAPSAAAAAAWAICLGIGLPTAMIALLTAMTMIAVLGICAHLLWYPSTIRVRARLTSVVTDLNIAKRASQQSQDRLAALEQPLLAATQGYDDLSQRLAEWRLKKDLERHEYLRSIQYRREQLAKQNWRAMRSVEFEQFLEAVFDALGYAVETTQVTGDQGVDLVVSKDGRRIAIQVKGYLHSVGNGAVQEAYTGQRHYRCSACAVITNSRFTTSARELAESVGCALIDEDCMPQLIMGQIEL